MAHLVVVFKAGVSQRQLLCFAQEKSGSLAMRLAMQQEVFGSEMLGIDVI